MNILSDQFMRALLADHMATVVGGNFSGSLTGLKLGLFTNSIGLSHQTVLADLTEPTYAGYARQNLVWGAVLQNPDGSAQVQGNLDQFMMTDAVIPTLVVGYFAATVAGTPYFCWGEVFPAPIALPNQYAALLISAQMLIGGPNFGSATILT